jgi:hypothetical protein
MTGSDLPRDLYTVWTHCANEVTVCVREIWLFRMWSLASIARLNKSTLELEFIEYARDFISPYRL